MHIHIYRNYIIQYQFHSSGKALTLILPIQNSWGQHGAHLGPVGPRWTPCWPHRPCFQGLYGLWLTGWCWEWAIIRVNLLWWPNGQTLQYRSKYILWLKNSIHFWLFGILFENFSFIIGPSLERHMQYISPSAIYIAPVSDICGDIYG